MQMIIALKLDWRTSFYHQRSMLRIHERNYIKDYNFGITVLDPLSKKVVVLVVVANKIIIAEYCDLECHNHHYYDLLVYHYHLLLIVFVPGSNNNLYFWCHRHWYNHNHHNAIYLMLDQHFMFFPPSTR